MNCATVRWLAAWLLACAAPFAIGAGVGTEAQERSRIAAERAAAQSAFGSRERHCQNSFVVTPCVEDARRDLREAMLRLRRQEAVLDEMQRRERAAQRMESTRARPAPAAAEAADAGSSVPGADKPSQRRREGVGDAKPPRVRAHAERQPKVSAEARQRAEALSEQKFEAASRAASSRRAEIERRNAERVAAGKGAAPLPVPAGASAP